MTKHVDVTDQVDFGNSDDETLPMKKCICGGDFEPWTWNISIYDDDATKCPRCGRKFFFRNSIRVYLVEE